MHERIQRDRELNPEEAAQLRKARTEFAQRPSKTQLLESGEYVGSMSIKEYFSWRKGAGGAGGKAWVGSAVKLSLANKNDGRCSIRATSFVHRGGRGPTIGYKVPVGGADDGLGGKEP